MLHKLRNLYVQRLEDRKSEVGVKFWSNLKKPELCMICIGTHRLASPVAAIGDQNNEPCWGLRVRVSIVTTYGSAHLSRFL